MLLKLLIVNSRPSGDSAAIDLILPVGSRFTMRTSHQFELPANLIRSCGWYGYVPPKGAAIAISLLCCCCSC